MPLDQVAPDGGRLGQRPLCRAVAGARRSAAEVIEKSGPGVLAGTEEDCVRMPSSLVRQRGDVQTAHRNVGAERTEVVGDLVRPARRSDVRLHDQEIRRVQLRDGNPFDVFVDQYHFVVRAEISRERGKTQRREERVLDRAKQRTRRLGQGRQDHDDPHGSLLKPQGEWPTLRETHAVVANSAKDYRKTWRRCQTV